MENDLLNENEYRRFKSKVRHAFKIVFDKYYKLIQFVARRCGAESYNCDDIVQEVFIRLHKHTDKICDQEHIKRWLMTTTRNLCMDHARKKSVEKQFTQQQLHKERQGETERESNTSQVPTNFATTLEIHELELMLVGELIDKVTMETNDETFALFYRDGLSAKEIATRQNTPVSTITNRISRTRKRFRAYFESHIKQLHEELL
ncbi:MAG: RNA polymerase sigma factor [Thiohalomonadales bacterium]